MTAEGRRLAGLYTELDLLVAECLRRGLWDELNPAELAACVSALTFESRRPDDAEPAPAAARPGPRGARGHGPDLGRARRDREASTGCRSCASPTWASPGPRTPGPAAAAGGGAASDLTPGDFVRATKQLIDLLDQVARPRRGPAPVAEAARGAIGALRRGVVAYSSVGLTPASRTGVSTGRS